MVEESEKGFIIRYERIIVYQTEKIEKKFSQKLQTDIQEKKTLESAIVDVSLIIKEKIPCCGVAKQHSEAYIVKVADYFQFTILSEGLDLAKNNKAYVAFDTLDDYGSTLEPINFCFNCGKAFNLIEEKQIIKERVIEPIPLFELSYNMKIIKEEEMKK